MSETDEVVANDETIESLREVDNAAGDTDRCEGEGRDEGRREDPVCGALCAECEPP